MVGSPVLGGMRKKPGLFPFLLILRCCILGTFDLRIASNIVGKAVSVKIIQGLVLLNSPRFFSGSQKMKTWQETLRLYKLAVL